MNKRDLDAFETLFIDDYRQHQALATNDYVAVNLLYRGTRQGTYLDIAPTGHNATFNPTDIMRLRGHQLAEHWGTVDPHHPHQQLTKK